MRKKVATLVVAAGTLLALLTSGGTAHAATDASTRVWEVGGSNMGVCSAYLGQLQVRDDVNQLINAYGDLLGIPTPGAVYSVRAKQSVNLPPAQECLQRTLP